MSEALKKLEARVRELERQLAELKAQVAGGASPEVPWWERIVGTHENDAAFEQIIREGRRIRRRGGAPDGVAVPGAAARKPSRKKPSAKAKKAG
jgi:hypothetical protein